MKQFETKKNLIGKKKRKRTTWTIQPADDVVKLLEEHYGKPLDELERGQLTSIINQSVRQHHAAAAASILDQMIAELDAQKRALLETSEGKH